MAKIKIIATFFEYENPSNAIAVRNTLAVVIVCVLKRFVSFAESKLDKTVPVDMVMDTAPIAESGTPMSLCIMGHAEPSSESGKPKLMKAK